MSNYKEERPWGDFTVLYDDEQCKVKRITVKPLQRLSYQKHAKREENWTVVQGKAVVTLNGEEYELSVGQHVFIEKGAAHRIKNPSMEETLVFVEVQTGEYFGEDDIIRLSDDYGRDKE